MTWPFGGRPADGGLPEPAPEIIMAANGVYWRRYPDSLSMVPVSTDNDPLLSPVAVYQLVGWEDHEGEFHEIGASGDTRPVLMVHADHSADDVRAFYEIPEAVTRLVQPEGDRRTFAQCLADLVIPTGGADV